MEGTNDIRSHHPWQTTKLNLQIMIDKAKAKGVIPILSTLTPSDQANSEVLIPNKYNPMIKELAATNKIPLVDQYSAIETSWPSLNNDGIHPNDNGYLYLAKTWWRIIPVVESADRHFTPDCGVETDAAATTAAGRNPGVDQKSIDRRRTDAQDQCSINFAEFEPTVSFERWKQRWYHHL